MAKLSARGRAEWLRARLGNQVVAFMSDGAVLYQVRDALTGRLGRWRHHARWDRVRVSLPMLRAWVIAHGWEIVRGDGPRAGTLSGMLSVLEQTARLPRRREA